MVPLILVALGAALILAALWNRDEPRKAAVLFVLGGILVLAAGLVGAHGVDLNP